MKHPLTWFAAFIGLGAAPVAAVAAALTAPPAKFEAPGVVALQQESSGWVYRQFPTGLRLYVSDNNGAGKANCIRECSFAWPPLLAENFDKATGDWSLVMREDGHNQWAYKGHPVYLLFHDSPMEPQGNGADGGTWHLLEP